MKLYIELKQIPCVYFLAWQHFRSEFGNNTLESVTAIAIFHDFSQFYRSSVVHEIRILKQLMYNRITKLSVLLNDMIKINSFFILLVK